MSVRGAKYKRRKNDNYPTPVETTAVILANELWHKIICDPCCGKKKLIMQACRNQGFSAVGDDLIKGFNFIEDKFPWKDVDIITNPPYGGRSGKLALAFIMRALEVTKPWQAKVAMLLPAEFDSGKTRQLAFGQCPEFSHKIVLTNRIRWFNGVSGSTNHAWYVWSHRGKLVQQPIISYAAQDYRD